MVDRHAAERSFEGVNSGERNASEGNVMGRTDQHDTCECLRTVAKCGEGRGGERAGVNVTRVWCNQSFGSDFQSRSGVGEEFFNLPSQPIGLRRIKAAGDRGPPGNHDCGPACILPGLQLMTIYNLNRPPHEST